MTAKAMPTEYEIRYAIEYALRSEAPPFYVSDGYGGLEEASIEPSELEPFVMRLLQELNVI
jgi:hypothetical protein